MQKSPDYQQGFLSQEVIKRTDSLDEDDFVKPAPDLSRIEQIPANIAVKNKERDHQITQAYAETRFGGPETVFTQLTEDLTDTIETCHPEKILTSSELALQACSEEQLSSNFPIYGIYGHQKSKNRKNCSTIFLE